MSHNLHPTRSSRSSRRNSPYSRPPSSLPSDQRQPPPYEFPSPASANYPSLHTRPSAGFHPQQDSNSVYHILSLEQQPSLLPQGQPPNFQRLRPLLNEPPRFSESNIRTLDVPSHHVDSQLSQPSSRHQSITTRDLTQGSFSHAHNFTMQNPVFIDNNSPVDNFMKDLLQHTIIGAEFDSSARDPPPRCHPGTRLKIIERCLSFVLECHGEEKLRWVVGPAGVGKSAVMQMVVEKAPNGVIFASVFLSVNGRRDGFKTILTIAYQLAVKCGPYRQFIQDEISLDPSLLQKSLSVQFNKFIVEPFIRRHLFDPPRRFLIAIDGLDESDNADTQLKLLELISNFCTSYPTSPIAWIVASRPEPHITSFFDKIGVQPVYIKEEIQIDSDEACEDVQRYLRDELNKIKLAKPSLRHRREWPSELEFTMIASAAGGLFAYASVVIRYINDPRYRDPTVQLHHVLEVIKGIPLADISERGHPMAQLDALYARILSIIPKDVMINVREMLLLCSDETFRNDFRLLCNFLGLTEDTAYGAISYLYAVMWVPEPDRADDECLEYFHKSFEDFLLDSKRSGFLHNVHDDAEQLMASTCLKIVEQVPHDSDGLTSGNGMGCRDIGILRGGPSVCNNISLSWPGDERFEKIDANLRVSLYRKSMYGLGSRFNPDRTFYGSFSSFQALTTRFSTLDQRFPFLQLRDTVFDKWRHELTDLGKMKQVPLRTLDYAAILGAIELRFTSPTGINVNPSGPWNPSCHHDKYPLGGSLQWQGWRTEFYRPNIPNFSSDDNSDALDDVDIGLRRIERSHKELLYPLSYDDCGYCSRLFARHFIGNPDLLATVFVDSAGLSYVECSFVDPDDGVSEWRYRFCHSGPPKPVNVE